jgi:predicted ester cyclase
LTAIQKRNIDVVTAWIAAYNARNFDALAELAADDLRVEDPATGTRLVGWPAFREVAEQIACDYPDRRITVTEMIPLGESAVAVQGDWKGTPAAGRRRAGEDETVRHTESMVVELIAGKISYRRIYR